MTSMIPFFILLLTAYTFSAPIGQENENSTIEYEHTTGQTTISMDFISSNQSTGSPIISKQRSVEDSDSNEVTTDYVTRPSRAFEASSTEIYKKRGNDYSSGSEESGSSEKHDSEESLISTSTSGYNKHSDATSQESVENESSEKRESNESVPSASTKGYKKNTPKSYLFTTLESSTVFNRRAIRPFESEEESTSIYPEKQMKMNTDVKPSSSSVDSFGKATGLLDDKSVDQSSEESQTPLPIRTQKITKTVSIIPGKVSETKFVTSVPTKSSVMMQPIQQEQLSQGQSKSVS